MTLPRMLLTNARVVLADQVIYGAVEVVDGIIARIGEPTAAGKDMGGDYLLPGLVELHTDHLEVHYAPRPGVRWSPFGALLAHDAQVAGAGITTVLDALRIGLTHEDQVTREDVQALGRAIHEASDADALRAEHYIHLRCEVPVPDCLAQYADFADDTKVRVASLMDHSPGQRQFPSLEAYRAYYQKKKRMTDAEFESYASARIADSRRYAAGHRAAIALRGREQGVVLASHDDATEAHVADARAHGVHVAEFPTTLEAARASRDAGMKILMGGPNVVRNGSHNGNISARDLAAEGLLDILSSDYVPMSLMQAAFALEGEIGLPAAVGLVTRQPARAAGFADRGEIAEGLRADLVRVRAEGPVPVVRAVWREGRRVA